MKNSVMNDFCYDQNIRIMLKKVDSLVYEKDIELFYTKKLFSDGKEFELYLFLKSKILKVGMEDGNFVTTSIYNKNSIEKVMLKDNYTKSYEKILEIKFKNDETFKFDSIGDTNQYNDSNSASIIQEIFKNLVSYKNKNTEIEEK